MSRAADVVAPARGVKKKNVVQGERTAIDGLSAGKEGIGRACAMVRRGGGRERGELVGGGPDCACWWWVAEEEEEEEG